MASTKSSLCSDRAVFPAPWGHRDKNHGDVEAHGRVEHAGCDLVAVRDANHGVGTVRVHHVLNGVCDDVSGGQAIEHAVMTHCDAVIDCNGIKFFGDTACVFNFTRDQLSQIFEMDYAPAQTV